MVPSRPSGDFQAAASRRALVFIGWCGRTWSQEDKCGKWVFWPRATAQSWRHSSPHLSAPFELQQPRNTESGLQTTSYPASPDGFCFQATRQQYRTQGLCIRLVRRLLGSLVAGDEGSGRGFLQEGSQPCGGAYSPLGKSSYTP